MNAQMIAMIITTMTPLIVPVLVAALKKAIQNMPKQFIPILAILIGAAIDIINNFLTGGGGGLFQGAILGAAGIGVREVLDQFRKSL